MSGQGTAMRHPPRDAMPPQPLQPAQPPPTPQHLLYGGVLEEGAGGPERTLAPSSSDGLCPKGPEEIPLPSAVHLKKRLTVSQSVS